MRATLAKHAIKVLLTLTRAVDALFVETVARATVAHHFVRLAAVCKLARIAVALRAVKALTRGAARLGEIARAVAAAQALRSVPRFFPARTHDTARRSDVALVTHTRHFGALASIVHVGIRADVRIVDGAVGVFPRLDRRHCANAATVTRARIGIAARTLERAVA